MPSKDNTRPKDQGEYTCGIRGRAQSSPSVDEEVSRRTYYDASSVQESVTLSGAIGIT